MFSYTFFIVFILDTWWFGDAIMNSMDVISSTIVAVPSSSPYPNFNFYAVNHFLKILNGKF